MPGLASQVNWLPVLSCAVALWLVVEVAKSTVLRSETQTASPIRASSVRAVRLLAAFVAMAAVALTLRLYDVATAGKAITYTLFPLLLPLVVILVVAFRRQRFVYGLVLGGMLILVGIGSALLLVSER